MIEETSSTIIEKKFLQLKSKFTTHHTFPIDFRIKQLRILKKYIQEHETEIQQALWNDLKKSPEEAFLTEIGLLLKEIDFHIKNLKKWTRKQRVATPIYLWPSTSNVLYQPLGTALIIAPWNYPFQLTINPLIGAISAGCHAIVKPSPDAPHTAILVEQLIQTCFGEDYITCVQGGKDTNTMLLQYPFDVIFFTGSPKVGKIIMQAAAKHLCPVVLELGGKSPCIIDKTATLKTAAKRVIWGKCINAGQTCIAPDYLLVHQDVQHDFIEELKKAIKDIYGENIAESLHYPRIISPRAFDRITALIPPEKVIFGGFSDKSKLLIEPTILVNVSWEDEIMQEEIFGPIIPIITFEKIEEAMTTINARPKPLALYYFGDKIHAKKIKNHTQSGGMCINDTLLHVSNQHLPFGGVGTSGIGNYHGKNSFKAFSHAKAIINSHPKMDIPWKYPPYKYFQWIKKFLQ